MDKSLYSLPATLPTMSIRAFGNNGDWLRVFEVPVPIVSERSKTTVVAGLVNLFLMHYRREP